MTDVMHISNTDIEFDSRIRKEIKALSQLAEIRVSSVGVPQGNAGGTMLLDGTPYRKLRLHSRVLKRLPRAIRYFIQLIEFTAKVVVAGRLCKPDVVHCHDTFALPAGWILKRQLGCRLVYDAHELESNKNAQSAILSWATLMIERACWKRVDLLISVSDSIVGWYFSHLGPKPNVVILNSPAIAGDSNSLPGTQERGSYFHVRYGIPANRLVFIYVGMFSLGRGIELCLDAFAAGPKDAHVVFLGFGSLEYLISEYSSRYPNIHLHAAVPHDQVVALVRSADYGLCLIQKASLSDYYCLPNKLFEYCFARVPVLASNFPEISRLVNQYSLGVCCDVNLGSVRSAIIQLTNRKAGRITSDISSLSWESQASRLAAVYRDRLIAPRRERTLN